MARGEAGNAAVAIRGPAGLQQQCGKLVLIAQGCAQTRHGRHAGRSAWATALLTPWAES